MANVSSSNGLEKHPKLRFKGFSEPWNSISFGELFTYLPNNTLSRAELNYESGEYQNVHYGDVLIKYGPVLDATTDGLPFITEYNDKNAHKQLLQSGDVIIADTAEDEAVGKATEIINVGKRKVVSGLHTIACRPRVEMAPTYLGFYINSETYHQQLYSLMQGVKVLSISKSNIEGTTLCYPTEAEQQKICDLLNLIELRIVKQRQLIEHLKKYKRGVSNKIFSEADKWDQVGFLDVFSTVSDKPYQVTTSEYYEFGTYEVVDQGKNDIVGYNNDESKVFYTVPIIVYGDHTTVIKFRNTPFIVGGDGVKLLTTNTNNNLQYLYYALCQYNVQPEGYKRHFSIVKNLNIPIPSIKEQQIIAETLATLDMKIQKESCLLEILLTQKKAFLQKLFI